MRVPRKVRITAEGVVVELLKSSAVWAAGRNGPFLWLSVGNDPKTQTAHLSWREMHKLHTAIGRWLKATQ
jgi:hypothetical protein